MKQRKVLLNSDDIVDEMKKVFIYNENSDPKYLFELNSIYETVKNDAEKIDIKHIAIEDLKNTDVVISNQLPEAWKFVLSGLNIVSVVIGNYESKEKYNDIVVDPFYIKKQILFCGDNYKAKNLIKNEIDYGKIFNLIQKLDWDSKFWGFPVAFLSSRHLTENIICRVEPFVKSMNIRLIEYLCDCHDRTSVEIAESNGYRFKDIRLTYQKKLLSSKVEDDMYSDYKLIKADAQHYGILRDLSRDIYIDSRYYYDANFDNEKVAEFYMLWAEKAVRSEYDDMCYLLKYGGNILGFATIKNKCDGLASIGLVGIDKKHSGNGHGLILMTLLLNKLHETGFKTVRVVTQGRNYSAQRLYQKAGFLTYSTELWYHKWEY